MYAEARKSLVAWMRRAPRPPAARARRSGRGAPASTFAPGRMATGSFSPSPCAIEASWSRTRRRSDGPATGWRSHCSRPGSSAWWSAASWSSIPDCDFRSEGAEWDRAMVADERASRRLEGWLRRLFSYWRGRRGRVSGPGEGALRTLPEYLRPDVDGPSSGAEVPLPDQVEDARRRVEREAKECLESLDPVRLPIRRLKAAAAGPMPRSGSRRPRPALATNRSFRQTPARSSVQPSWGWHDRHRTFPSPPMTAESHPSLRQS